MNNKKTVLVTGGAGYIGSHTAFQLARQGYRVIVLDALLQEQDFHHPWATFIKGDFADIAILNTIFSRERIDAVMHFAAFIEVGESVKYPRQFYENNVTKTIALLDCMLDHGVRRFVFSSSCAIYGVPQRPLLDELHPYAPVSPYGHNKLAIEFVLQDYARAYGLVYASLRYFNAAGADVAHGLGEQHKQESHLIPLVLRALAQRQAVTLFGDDYATVDGSCVRDYVHVVDLATAHLQAYQHLCQTGQSEAFNLGSGSGYTVRQVINVAQKITGISTPIIVQPRREGDSPVLVADNVKARRVLGWEPHCSDLSTIISSAWEWEQRYTARQLNASAA